VLFMAMVLLAPSSTAFDEWTIALVFMATTTFLCR